jgi:hypothetical protein
LFKIVHRSYENACGVDKTPQSPETRVVRYNLGVYGVFIEGVVV